MTAEANNHIQHIVAGVPNADVSVPLLNENRT
jgi:hypothetical protein